MFNLLRFAVLLCAFWSQAQASQVLIDIDKPQYQIGQAVSFYEDVDNTLDLDQIDQISSDRFKPVGQAVSAHLFTLSTFYYRFKVVNHENDPVDRLIVFETPWLDDIKLRVESPSGQRWDYATGNIHPYSERAVKDRNPNIEHRFEPGVSEVYVEMKTRDPFIVPISILDRDTVYQDQVFDLGLATFIYGIIFAMILYHLVMFLFIRLRYYGFYVVYLGSFLVMNASYNGYTFPLFFSDYPGIQNWMQSTTIFLFSIAGLLFAKSFLNLKKYLPWAQTGVNALIFVFIATMIVSAWFGYHYHVMLAIMMSVLFSGYVFVIALLSVLKGNHFARFFLLGTTAGLIGTSITATTVMALIPYSVMGYKAIDFGMVVDSILLSFALVDRVKSNEKERQSAERLAKTDVLTGLLNRRAYSELCDNESSLNKKLHTSNLTALMIDIDHFKRVNDTHGHSAGDIVLQRVARLLKNTIKDSDHIFRLGGEEFLILLPNTDKAQAVHLSERIRTAVENMDIVVEGRKINITISIGICEYGSQISCISQVEFMADKALYAAKQAGRNQVVVAP